jgi:mRNA interferase MazF
VTRGEVWLTRVGRKTRPVLVLTRPEVIDVRNLVTVAEVTTSIRGLAAEVDVDHVALGLDRPSVINCDGIHTVGQAMLTTVVGAVGDATMRKVCSAVSYASAAEFKPGAIPSRVHRSLASRLRRCRRRWPDRRQRRRRQAQAERS